MIFYFSVKKRGGEERGELWEAASPLFSLGFDAARRKKWEKGKHGSRDGTLEIPANNRHPTRRERGERDFRADS